MSTSNRVAQSLSQGDIKLEVDESIKPTHNENGQKLIYCSDGVITEDEIMGNCLSLQRRKLISFILRSSF